MSCRVEQTILRQRAMTVRALLGTSNTRAKKSMSAPKVDSFFVLADRARKTANEIVNGVAHRVFNPELRVV